MASPKEVYRVVLAEGSKCKIVWTGWGPRGSISLHKDGHTVERTGKRSPGGCAKFLDRVKDEPFCRLLRTQEEKIEDFLKLKDRQHLLQLMQKYEV